MGIETGLDSNGRKNRGGHQMEDLVEKYIKAAGFVKDVSYFKEMYIKDIEAKWGLDLSSLSSDGRLNYKAAIGEPLTLMLRNFILSKVAAPDELSLFQKVVTQEMVEILKNETAYCNFRQITGMSPANTVIENK